MSDTADLLEVLQADVLAVLKNTPGLSTLNILADNAGDIEARVQKSLGALTAIGGKNGLSIVVLRPEVTQAESNMPGPPLTLKVEVQCIEHVLFNRAAATGTLVRSSQAALMVLRALGLCGLGSRLLYADKDPIQPVPVKPGYVSDAVTVYCKVAGLEPAAKPLAVQAEMVTTNGSAVVSGSLMNGTNPITFPTMPFAGEGPAGGDMYDYPFDGTQLAFIRWNGGNGSWELLISDVTLGDSLWSGWGVSAETPLDEIVWLPSNSETGTPIITLISGGNALQLTCATAGSTIRYTLDGKFPTPESTLYSAPITGLQAGTIVRAAAYVTGMAPSDITEILITE